MLAKKKKEIEKLFKRYNEYAKENGFHLNPDKEITYGLLEALIERKRKYGKMYCPCRRIKGVEEQDNKIICPCVYHKKEINEDGHCHCFLFVK